MAISNSINFSVTRDEIITQAYRQLGILAEGETCNEEQIIETSPILNMMLKTWQADGLNLFAIQKNYLFIIKEQKNYVLNSTTSDHFTASFVETTLSADAVETDTVISVTDATGISTNDYIVTYNGTDSQWNTVSSVSSNDITLTNALTSDIVSGSIVYAYTSKANKPMGLIDGYTHTALSNADIPLEKMARREYMYLTPKSTTGLVTQMYFDNQLSAPELFVWPTGQDERNYLTLYVQKTLSDLDGSTDNPEYPQEWFLPIYLNLALLIAPRYGIPNDVYSKIAQQATYWYEAAKGFDDELDTSVYLQPNIRDY